MNRLVIIVLFLLLAAGAAHSDREADFSFAQKLYSDGYYDLAASQYAQFIANYPDDSRVPLAYFMRGKSLMEIERWNDARASMLRVALEFSQSKNAAEALYSAAVCLRNLNRWREAARGFLSVSEFYPKSEFSARGMVDAGIIYRISGDADKAKVAFERILSAYPGTISAALAYYNLGEIAEEAGDDETALRNYNFAGKIAEDEIIQSMVKIRRALIYRNNGDWETAAVELEEVTAPIHSQYAALLKGIWLQKEGDYAAAEKALSDVADLGLNDTLKTKALFHLGDNYYLKEEYVAAFSIYRDLPESDSLMIRLGMTYSNLNKANQAADAFAKTLKMTGSVENKAVALNELRRLYASGAAAAQVSDILTSYLPKLKELPDWDSFAAAMGALAFEEGSYRLAREFLKELEDETSLWSDDGLYYMARAAEAERDSARAIELYDRFRVRYPGSDFSRDVEYRLDLIHDHTPVPDLMERIASLSSSSMDFTSKAALNLAWGRLYLEGFKDYDKALDKLKAALDSKDITRRERGEAQGLMALTLMKKAVLEPELAGSARAMMKSYLQNYYHREFAGRFVLELLKHRVSTITDTIQRNKVYAEGLEDLAGRFKDDPVLPEAFAELVRVYSCTPGKYSRAVDYSASLKTRFPDNHCNEYAQLGRARARTALGDTSEAIVDYEIYMEKYPDAPGIFNAEWELVRILPDHQRKVNLTKDLIERYYYNSNIPYLIEYLGDLYAEKGLFGEALRQYQMVAEKSNPAPILQGKSDLYYKIGLSYQRMGKFEEAQKYFLEYAVDNPEGGYWEEAVFALAEISENEDRAPVALKFYQNLISHSRNTGLDQRALERTAAIFYRIGRYSEGRKQYLQLAQNAASIRKKAEYTANAIIGLYRIGALDDAREEAVAFAKEYRRLEGREEHQASFYLEKGKYQAGEKNFSEALETLKQVLKRYAKTRAAVEAEYEIGKIYLITNHFDEALDILTKMPQKYPNHKIVPAVHLTLGTFYYRQSQFQNALLAFQNVLDNPGARDLWPVALKNLEATYKDLGLFEAALATVNKYLDLFPFAEDIVDKKLDAAQLMIRVKEYDRATRNLEELLSQASSEMQVEIQFYLGEAYFQKGDFEQAALEYMKVKYLDPGGGLDWAVTAIYNTGQCYEKLSRFEDARNMYRAIIKRWGLDSDYGRGAQKRIDAITDR